MPYVGNSPAANFASVTKDTFSGDGSETAFTLSKAATTNGVAVFVENVRQEPTTAYAVSGTTLTFTAAPVSSSGNNIYVLHHNSPASTATHPAAQALTATSGTFTGAFTSLGIDDNADATAITIDSSEDVTLSGNLLSGVNKNIDVRDADGHVSGRLRNVSGSNNALTIEADPDNSASSSYISFKVDTSEKMKIESDGTVLITSQDLKVGDGSSADSKLQFDSNASDWSIGIDQSDSGNLKVSNGTEVHSAPRMIFKAGGLIEHYADRDGNLNYYQNSHSSSPFGLSVYFDQAAPDNNTSYFLKCADTGATRCTIFSDGDVATADAGTLSSDEKLKNTITDATDKWDDVKKLKVRNFYWNEDYHPNKKDKKMIGFIAQEFETVFPGLVKNYKDTIDKEVEDENGVKSIEAVETGTTTKHIKEAKLIPILTKALQEAMTRIETLEAEVAKLKE